MPKPGEMMPVGDEQLTGVKTRYKIMFNDWFMQKHYEELMKKGMPWNKAYRKTVERFSEYDEGY